MCPSASPVRRPFDSPRLRRIRGERKRRTCEPFRESVKDRATPEQSEWGKRVATLLLHAVRSVPAQLPFCRLPARRRRILAGEVARSAAPASRSWLTNPAVSGSRIRCRQRSADALAEAIAVVRSYCCRRIYFRLNPFRTFCPNTFVRCGLRVTCSSSRS